ASGGPQRPDRKPSSYLPSRLTSRLTTSIDAATRASLRSGNRIPSFPDPRDRRPDEHRTPPAKERSMTTLTPSGTTRGPAAPSDDARVLLRPLAPGHVTIDGGLWARTADVNRAAAIPEGLEQLEKAGNLRNLEIAAGRAEGEAIGPIFADSDVHKWLEA